MAWSYAARRSAALRGRSVPEERPVSTPVTSVGARRRITALAWLGWSPAALVTVTGLPE
jgi:hypothetical protein